MNWCAVNHAYAAYYKSPLYLCIIFGRTAIETCTETEITPIFTRWRRFHFHPCSWRPVSLPFPCTQPRWTFVPFTEISLAGILGGRSCGSRRLVWGARLGTPINYYFFAWNGMFWKSGGRFYKRLSPNFGDAFPVIYAHGSVPTKFCFTCTAVSWQNMD